MSSTGVFLLALVPNALFNYMQGRAQITQNASLYALQYNLAGAFNIVGMLYVAYSHGLGSALVGGVGFFLAMPVGFGLARFTRPE